MTIRYGVPILLVALGIYQVSRLWKSMPPHLEVVDEVGNPVREGLLEFFVWDDSGAAASPTRKLGEQPLDGEGQLTFDDSLVPGGEALVRVTAGGFGKSFAFVRNGRLERCVMQPPGQIAGVVLGPDRERAAGVKVQILGGGHHGVLLAEQVTRGDGSFEFTDISRGHQSLHLRAFKECCSILSQDFDAWADELTFKLSRTEPVVGQVVAPDGLAIDGLRVHVFNVPGLDTTTDSDGKFYLDHLPPPPKPVRLLLTDLPSGYTHSRVSARASDNRIELRVHREATVRGRVLNASTGMAVPFAGVTHEHGPRGREAAVCNANGVFEIRRVPPGRVRLNASYLRRIPNGRPHLEQGALELWIQEGQEVADVSITIQ